MSAAPPSYEPRNRRAFRLALGVTVVFTLSQIYQWPVALLASAGAVALLQDAKAMPFWFGLRTIIIAMAALAGGFLTALLLSGYPAVMVLTYGFLFILLFRFVLTTGEHLIIFVGLLVGCTVIPVLVLIWPELALVATIGAMTSFFVAWLISTFAFAIIRPPADVPPAHEHSDSDLDVTQISVALGLILATLLAVFLVFGLTDILVLIYSTIFALSLTISGVRESFLTYLVANLVLAGLATIVVYEILVMVPSLPMMSALVFLVMYVFAQQTFGHSPMAAAWSSACFGFVLLLSGTLPKEGVIATDKVLDRVMQIGTGALYVAAVFALFGFISRARAYSNAGGPNG